MIPPERDCFSGLSQPFSSLTGPARAAVLSLCLGIVLTLHLTELLHVVLGYDALLPVDWSLYVVSLCVFHLSEYFLVAQYNPQDLSSSGTWTHPKRLLLGGTVIGVLQHSSSMTTLAIS
eukprot:gb/GECG01001309.1/.p1 GENE.gb/GECG01001309.1/~~gb/GECG01001309.1/.p1  ORF type:complete len:119 (+),score=6.96 gb/GECG01001309.1/:1-357(+)